MTTLRFSAVDSEPARTARMANATTRTNKKQVKIEHWAPRFSKNKGLFQAYLYKREWGYSAHESVVRMIFVQTIGRGVDIGRWIWLPHRLTRCQLLLRSWCERTYYFRSFEVWKRTEKWETLKRRVLSTICTLESDLGPGMTGGA